MFKFKNFKILLLLMLFAFAGNDAWAGDPDYWMYIHLNQKCEPTGSGKVYASTNPLSADNPSNCVTVSNEGKEYVTSTHESNINNKNWVSGTQWFVNTIPIDVWSYGFVGWKNGDGQIVSTEPSPLQSFYDPGVYAAKNSDGTGGKTENKPYYQPNPFPFSLELTAVYEEIDPIVVAVPENYSIGNTIISKANNEVEDNIEIFAYPILPSSKFIGWYKDGVLESIQNPYSFTIEDETRHTYTAKFRTGYSFYRVINKHTGRIINGIKDQGDISDLSALQLVDYETAQVSAGSVFEIKYHNSKYPESVDFIVQNFDPGSKYYDYDKGIYMCMRHKIVDNTWKIHPNRNTPFLADKGSGDVVVGENITNNYNSQEYVDWFLEPFDLDLETKENYFSLDPNKLVEVDGKYYTTLRTSWNILFNPEQMTPYIVKSVDETEGTFEMEPITGNIIPAGTPVIIETKSNDVEKNRMVPTKTNATNGAVPSGNLLQHSEKYFPNQNAPVSNCKGLYKNANGQLAFGGDALNTVNGNEAYLSVADEVTLPVKIPNVTLAELLASGDTQRTYNVTDLTAIKAVNGDRLLICKDNNGYANKDERSDEEYIDFMHTASQTQGLKSVIPDTYDQSNWIGLRIPDGENVTQGVMNRPLKGVVGKLTSTVNPEFILEQMPVANGDAVNYTPNVYIAASFNEENHQKSPVNQKEYYFVRPKPMEYANVEWAQWKGEKFIAPVHNEEHQEWNQLELVGEFEFNGSYLEQGGVFLESGHAYEMLPAIIKVNDGSNYPHVYVLGDVNDQGWSPQKGVEMYTTDGNIYTATVTVNNVDNGYGYFSFTNKLGADWEGDNGIASYRFGAVADGPNFLVLPEYIGNELSLAYWSKDSRSFQVAQGIYKLTVNLQALKLVITPAQSRAPGVKDGSNGYVVYPLQINKVTNEENGVITAIDNMQQGKTVTRVVYYNLMGVESDKPHHGINIVETRYSDGTRSVEKVMK